ncbi:shikimate dehydrogenase [Advenella mimigardefordensis]|uniref:Shikimate dehydrogenase (NADP(+)) n=1 Tax=Advenella mimigardefordensis (strain DSM 17166 / LMG 22922 / DPN7) TaxID=1247726 RepID=W0PJ19_ADVMD|nr:shikimate dehydrogenase [Advenella mimigardefordensis]AHG65013.1 shikimate dehydrogenase [Advenella mimigardefordensis DPN7]
MNTPRIFAVLGNPIKHSLSPRLHTLFGLQTGLQIEYIRQCVEPANFNEHVRQFFANGGRGLNITLPFKEQAYALAGSHISERARAAGSANTLWQENGAIHACNTDGVGLVNDMLRQHVTLRESRILLIGAGGATRGVLPALLQAGCAHLHIVNRTEDKAHALAAQATVPPATQAQVTASAFSALQGNWDIIINATSSSLSGEPLPLPDSVFRADSVAYDMLYTASGDTPFLQQARAAGALHTSDGLGMLVYQGAESFRIWNQIEPDAVPVLAALRTELTESR